MHLLLPTETLTVYRLKHWIFTDGTAPALQLEYASPVRIADTAALRRQAYRLWPYFVPYAEADGVRSAIITATILRKQSLGVFAATNNSHFGIIAMSDSVGRWHFENDSATLPPADCASGPKLVDPGGRVIPFAEPAKAYLDDSASGRNW